MLARGALRHRHERGARDAMDALARQANALNADGQAVWSCPPDAGDIGRDTGQMLMTDLGMKSRIASRLLSMVLRCPS